MVAVGSDVHYLEIKDGELKEARCVTSQGLSTCVVCACACVCVYACVCACVCVYACVCVCLHFMVYAHSL